MAKSALRRAFNRVLHALARQVPGSGSLRPFLHRLRGVKIGKGVFIGDDVYVDNEYPECIELHDGVSISMRALLIAHTRGPGKIIVEKDAFVGPNAILSCYAGRTLRIGEGAVVSAGAVVSRSVPARTLVAPPPSRAIAKLTRPLNATTSIEDFLAGMTPIRRTPGERGPGAGR
jgi:acetyltransferase-like isoleucine patch superfamily enzyme